MKSVSAFAIAVLAGAITACAAAHPYASPGTDRTPVPTATPPTVPGPTGASTAAYAAALAQFPLELGNTWVYSSTQYSSVPLHPDETMTATYWITRTVSKVHVYPHAVHK